jgi:molybdopterin-containing oxidoreductase family iron-sulfur binding subunit
MKTPTQTEINLDAVRAKLSSTNGPEYWRSLEEVAETPEFKAWVDDEFPNRRSIADIDRRNFLKLMGASMLLAGIGGCRSMYLPSEKAVPYVKMPENMLPGKPQYYATAYPLMGTAMGVLVQSYDGRPIKIEGNPSHPASRGATDYFAQASILDLYDPDRMKGVQNMGDESTWDILLSKAREALQLANKDGGAGIRFITGEVHSPTEIRLLKQFFAKYPQAKIAQYQCGGGDNVREGSQIAFGKPVSTIYDLSGAKVVLSLDADFLHSMPNSVAMARDFMAGRKVSGANADAMSRLYTVECTPSPTGAMADHRLAVSPNGLDAFARGVAQVFGIEVMDVPQSKSVPSAWIQEVAADLQAAGADAVVIAGPYAPASVHALAHAINAKLASTKVKHYESGVADFGPNNTTLQAVVADATKSGTVNTIIVLGGDPAFNAPSDLELEKAFNRATFTVHITTQSNDTSAFCKWVGSSTHYLEHWSDVTSLDGTTSIIQPLIAPLHDSKSPIEFLSMMVNNPIGGYDIVRETWKPLGGADFDDAWSNWLNEGVVKGASAAPIAPTLNASLTLGPAQTKSDCTVIFRNDPTILDGRFANNGWLQELPKVMTTLTWDNAALISANRATELGIKDGDHVKITVSGKSVTMPALILVGQSDEVVTLHMGYGRKAVGSVGRDAGANVNALRTSEHPYSAKATVEKDSGRTQLALTQTHHSMEGRDILKAATVAEFKKNPGLKVEGDELAEKGLSMWPSNDQEFPWDGAKWGMTIDLSLCMGCHACVAACQSENNIPVVGKEQVIKGREMHWIRIDRYYRVHGHTDEEEKKGVMSKNSEITNSRDITDPSESRTDILNPNTIETVFSPVACMHCEKAPCEPVCPVAATVHSHEGLNQMVYNRCVGTRYCSNNCPYKVRRFNFLNYTDNELQFMEQNRSIPHSVISTEKPGGIGLLKLMNNPNVTVRGRGVMEKCTYCVQRINQVRIEAKKENRPIRDGEVVTACQQACPTQAITFGNIADANSAVAKLKKEPRSYLMLPELNTQNRTSYLARLRNPNTKLEAV